MEVAAPRRVTVVAQELRGFVPSGGMGTATTLLALALARIGHSVEILVGINRPEAMDPQWADVYARSGVGIRAAPPLDENVEPWHFRQARSIELGLRAKPPDVVVAPDFGALAYTALRLRETGIAFGQTLFVVFCHGPRRYALELMPNLAPNDLRHVLAVGIHEQAAVELADVVVSPSAFLVDWMHGSGWRLPEQTLVIPYFTRSTATGAPVARASGAETGRLQRLAFFGRLDERKGLTLFADALDSLEPRLLEQVELDFVGRATTTWSPERIEARLSKRTRQALRDVSFATNLDQHEALERLRRPGTLAVMPSLQENSPNAVYECLEHAIPFIASNVGGVPELIAEDDRRNVLFEPTAQGVEGKLRAVLSAGDAPAPARPGFDGAASAERWATVVELRPRERVSRPGAGVDVVVVHRGSADVLSRCLEALGRQTYGECRVVVVAPEQRELIGIQADVVVRAETDSVDAARRAGLQAGFAPTVLFLDDRDIPSDELVATLAAAQSAADADVVSCAVRRVTGDRERLHFFSGDPGGVGVLANGYGTVALFRRSVLAEADAAGPSARDPDWPLLSGLAAAGARIVSVPAPLVSRPDGVGAVEKDPADALAAAQQLERALPAPLRSTARLAAGLAADAPRATAAKRQRGGVGLAVVALTLLAAAVRFSTLGRQSYWYDELATVSVLHRSFGAMLHAVARSEATPYLYYVLAWPWTRLFGLGEAGLRSLSALAGTLAVPVTYAAGAALVSRRVGLIAAAIVAVNPFLVWYSQEARAYGLFALLAALTVYFFARALRGGRRSLAAWAITAALTVATHYFAAFIVAAEALWLLARRRPAAWLAVALPVAVLLAEVPLIVAQRNNGGNLGESSLAHRVVGIPKDLVVGYSFPAELAGTVVAALLVLVGLLLAFRAARRAERRTALVVGGVAALALVAPIVVAVFGVDYVVARNMIAVVVPAAIFLGVGYAAGRAGITAALLLCAVSLAIVGSVAADTRYGRTDWRGAAEQLRPPVVRRALVVTPTIDPILWRPYLPGLQEPASQSIRASEIVVLGLASQGGLSTGAVHPPTTPPRAAPSGFRLVSTERTPTFVLVRYRSSQARPVARSQLAALGLGAGPAAVFLQGAGTPRR